ncbi:MAG: SLC26A/SulP transporter family protein [Hyphomicrobiales bacterium]|nr:SLC26A/SulP transporter family protein [Hyphomicrobiales bacterium]MCP5371720.1 SLC26A/SulP transporter family protein [Hyphomicrobiales bacterium]
MATLPQAVAYGLIALSPLGTDWAVFGITASVGTAILFGAITGALGSNPFLVSGPRAVTALVLAVGIGTGLGRGFGPGEAVALAFAGVVVAGLFQVAAGVLRLGHVVSFVPVPVLAGFVNASALLVFINSLPMVLGAPDTSIGELLAGGAGAVEPWAAAVGGATVVTVFLMEGRLRLVPSALGGLAVGTALYHFGVGVLDQAAAPQVGHVDLTDLLRPPLLVTAGLDWIGGDPVSGGLGGGWGGLRPHLDIPLLTGLSIGLLTSFDTVLSSSALDVDTGTTSRANHDLRLHGLANAAMGVLGFLPGSGTLSRSSAIIKSGARTRAANVGTGLVFWLMLAALAPVVDALPLWATAGMLVATALQAVDRPTLDKVRDVVTRRVAYPRVVAGDISVTLAVVVTALALDLIAAVGVGIVLAIALFLFGMGRDPVRRTYSGARVHSKVQRPAQQVEWLERQSHRIAVVEVQGALFFGACASLQSRAKGLLERGAEYLILDFRHLTSIDSTGSEALRALHQMCAGAGGQLLVSCVEPERRAGRARPPATPPAQVQAPAPAKSSVPAAGGDQRRRRQATPRWVWLNLDANGVIDLLGERWFFDDTDSALAACEDMLLTREGLLGHRDFRDIIASSAIFAGLARPQIVSLGHFAHRHRFAAGDTVFRQGDNGDRVYLLVAGRMDVLINIPGSSRRRRVSVLTEGTLFGEMGLIDGAPRSATVLAVRDSACFSIDATGLAKLEADHPDAVLVLMRNLSRLFADRLRMANGMISELEQ